MADIRIKDLTTTASSTASDDFIAVDGTTNGTRKLNAFSPTFGGNATVTGTLTANSAITGPTLAPGVNTAAHYFTAYGATTSWPLRLSTIYDSNYVDQYLTLNGTLTGSRATPTFTGAAVGGSFIRSNGENSVLSVGTFVSGAGAAINTVAVFNPTNVTIPQTTASTTTSTGALVVSGGVGVGGAINAGGDIATAGTMRSVGFHVPGNGAARPASTDSYLASTATTQIPLYVSGYTGGGQSADILRVSLNSSADWFSVKGNGQVSCFATTASTSTSSGALVVSGGVGVAGAIFAGGYASTASHARIGASGSVVALSAANNVDSGLPAAWNGNYGLGVYYSAASTNTILIGDGSAGTTIFATRTGSANTSRITIDNTNGNTTFAGAISIGNTVNTVSPTSPNRTITMVIGGTTYYLAAKTTND